jgi:hypothetical protein
MHFDPTVFHFFCMLFIKRKTHFPLDFLSSENSHRTGRINVHNDRLARGHSECMRVRSLAFTSKNGTSHYQNPFEINFFFLLCKKQQTMAKRGQKRQREVRDYPVVDGRFEIPLRNKKGEIVDVTHVSLSKKEKIENVTIYLKRDKKGRRDACCLVIVDGKTKNMLLSRYLTDAPDGMEVDHVNLMTLDNTDENLRIVTGQVNSLNRVKKPGTTSQYLGVRYVEKFTHHPWEARYAHKHIGSYETEKAAAWAVDEYKRSKFGPDVHVNGVAKQAENIGKEVFVERNKELPIGISPRLNGGYHVSKKFRGQHWERGFKNYSDALAYLNEALASIKAQIDAEKLEDETIEIERSNGFAVLICSSQDGDLLVYVDDDVWRLYRRCALHIHGGYPRIGIVDPSTGTKVQVLLHRLIMNAQRGDVIDHINLNVLDARRDNLRFATKSLNAHNRSVSVTKESGIQYIGVSWQYAKYRAAISKDGEKYHCGAYYTPELAAWARDQMAIHLFGKDARLNDVNVEGYVFDIKTRRAVKIGEMPNAESSTSNTDELSDEISELDENEF